MKRARRDEEDVIRPDGAVFGLDGRALDDGEQVALHPLARNIGAVVAARGRGDLVHLIEEDDARLFGTRDGFGVHLVGVDDLIALLLSEQLEGLGHLHPARVGLGGEHAPEHVLEVDPHLVHVHPAHKLDLGALVGDLELDLALVELSFKQHQAEFLARPAVVFFAERVGGLAALRGGGETRRAGKKKVEHALEGQVLGLGRVLRPELFLDHASRQLGQIADHGFDVAADVADLGELAGLHLDKGALGEAGEAAGDLGFAHPGGADHNNILGGHLIAHLIGQLLAAPAVAQRHGDGALGVRLADDVAVELLDDLLRGEVFHQSVSTEI